MRYVAAIAALALLPVLALAAEELDWA